MSANSPPNYHGAVDSRLVLGAMIFGLGWGIGSMCPGPVYLLSAVFEFRVQGLWLIGCILGMLTVQLAE